MQFRLALVANPSNTIKNRCRKHIVRDLTRPRPRPGEFWRSFLGLFLGRSFCRSGCFSVSFFAYSWYQKLFLEWFWRHRQNDAKKGMAAVPGTSRKGGWFPMITSGLGLSWVMMPLDPWSLESSKGGPSGNWSRLALETRSRIWLSFSESPQESEHVDTGV